MGVRVTLWPPLHAVGGKGSAQHLSAIEGLPASSPGSHDWTNGPKGPFQICLSLWLWNENSSPFEKSMKEGGMHEAGDKDFFKKLEWLALYLFEVTLVCHQGLPHDCVTMLFQDVKHAGNITHVRQYPLSLRSQLTLTSGSYTLPCLIFNLSYHPTRLIFLSGFEKNFPLYYWIGKVLNTSLYAKKYCFKFFF
jgi:hypothetical protein